MKKYLFTALFILSISFSYSQIVVTPDGFRASSDTSVNYATFKFSGRSNQQLFSEVLSIVNKNVANGNARKEIKTSDGYSIIISGESDLLRISSYNLYIKYLISLDFKDEKLRYTVHNLVFDGKGTVGEAFRIKGKYKKGGFNSVIYSLEDELISAEGKDVTEKFVNDIINDIVLQLNEWGSW